MTRPNQGQRDAAPETEARRPDPETNDNHETTTSETGETQEIRDAARLNSELASRRHREKELKSQLETLQSQLSSLQTEKQREEQKRLEEQGKWQEIAEQREAEKVEVSQRFADLQNRYRQGNLRAALTRDLASKSITGERAELLIDAVLPKLSVEFDGSDNPTGDWSEILEAKIKAAGWDSSAETAPETPAKPREIQLSQLQKPNFEPSSGGVMTQAQLLRAFADRLKS